MRDYIVRLINWLCGTGYSWGYGRSPEVREAYKEYKEGKTKTLKSDEDIKTFLNEL